uniref:Protein Wnt n=1 Tax=Eupentacta fraudatrix TaxID=1774088 RepID=A0A0U3DIS3_9ECHN|nr:Wnt16 [Eupentacta fraudatrix]
MKRITGLIPYTTQPEHPHKRRNWPTPFDLLSPSLCRKVFNLGGSQRILCEEVIEHFPGVSGGAKLAISECPKQFVNERWNCSTNNNLQNPFGRIIDLGTKETGFAYVITSAGVVYAVTQACSAGNITDCTCHSPKGRPGKPGEDTMEWRWGGCSDNIMFAFRIARKFVDATEGSTERSRVVRSKMNLHNNELGREAIVRQMKTKCRCHGVSSSCTLKTCWKEMPDMRHIGDFIKERYRSSIHATFKKKKNRLKPRKGSLDRRSVKRDRMVHITSSPTFCQRDADNGITGTSGRECNMTGPGPNSCTRLCCGRGYNRRVERIVDDKCNCQFIWCCKVKCQSCEYVREVTTCK